MRLDEIRHCRLTLTVLGDENRAISANIRGVSGARVLIAVDEDLKAGVAISLTWNDNLILGEIQGIQISNDETCYIVNAEEFIRLACAECERLWEQYDRQREIHGGLLKGAKSRTCSLERATNERQDARLQLLTHTSSHRTR